jgi:hypothetical protein
MSYPIGFEMDYVQRRSRLTTFLRYLLAIPHFFFAFFYEIAFFVVLVLAWFALLITGTWPDSLYSFAGGFLRYLARLTAYLSLGVDAYPPFTGAEDDSYPVRVHIAPPLAKYSRLKVLFRAIYVILAYVIRYALGIVLGFVSVLSWVAIVITGRQPASLQSAIKFCLAYTIRADALMLLITETYPPFGEDV